SGQGQDATRLSEATRARWRKQALEWLQADLRLWTMQLKSGTPQTRGLALETLRHWQRDPDLAGLRGEAALAKLLEAEREACRKLWADVDALLKQARDKE